MLREGPRVRASKIEQRRGSRRGYGEGGDEERGEGRKQRLTLLHLGDELLVEQTTGLLVEGAVDGDDVALGQQLLEGIDAAAANLGLLLGRQGLVVKVEKLLAVEGLQAAQHTLADASDGDGSDDLAFQVELVLGGSGYVPLTGLDHLVGGDEVADEHEDGHDDVLGDRDDVGAGDLGNGDTAIGLVGGVQVHVVGANAGGDGKLELLGLGKTLGGQVAGVEARYRNPRVSPRGAATCKMAKTVRGRGLERMRGCEHTE